MKKYVKCTKVPYAGINFELNKVYECNEDYIQMGDSKYSVLIAVAQDYGYEFEEVENPNDVNMPDREIFKMLLPKLGQYGLRPATTLGGVNLVNLYTEEHMVRAVATAYKSGYFRSQKGRPFKFKKKNESKPKSNKFVVNKNGEKIYYCDDKVQIGDKVVFVLDQEHTCSAWPPLGTVGEVVDYNYRHTDEFWVKWLDFKQHPCHNWRSYCKKVVE